MLEGGDGGICVTSFQMPPYLLLEDQHRIRYLKVNVFLETAAVKELFCSFHNFILSGLRELSEARLGGEVK